MTQPEKKSESPPFTPLVDVPEADPGAPYVTYAARLADGIRTANPPQLTVGIFGGYGSGKTTLMRAVWEKLVGQPFRDGFGENADKTIRTVWFDAWRYDHEPNLFLPFLATLARHPSIKTDGEHHPIQNAFRAFLRGFTLKVPEVLEFSASDATAGEKELNDAEKSLLESCTSGYLDVSHELAKLVDSGQGHRIVVFVDDLDRCMPNKAFALLEALKALTDIPGFVFVFGLDPRAVAEYVRRKYGKSFGIGGDEYLQKMFQLPFTLPDFTATIFGGFWQTVVGRHKKTLSEKEVSILTEFPPRTVREFKRVVNARNAIGPNVDSADLPLLLALLLFRSLWPSAYGRLFTDPKAFHKSSIEGGTPVDPRLVRYYRDVILPCAQESVDRIVQVLCWVEPPSPPMEGATT